MFGATITCLIFWLLHGVEIYENKKADGKNLASFGRGGTRNVQGATGAKSRIRYVALDPDLGAPVRQDVLDAGVDLRAAESFELKHGEVIVVPTGIAVEIPAGWAGLVCPRSGLAASKGVTVVNAPGVIDAGYTGEVKVVLTTLCDAEPVRLERGERIAQLVLTPVSSAQLEAVSELSGGARGTKGFGSSGTH